MNRREAGVVVASRKAGVVARRVAGIYRVYTHTHTLNHWRLHVCKETFCTYTSIHTHMHLNNHIHTYCAFTLTYTNTYTPTNTRTYCAYTYIHVHTSI